jgi:diguanylate cyclase (GGDEF)-like protein
MMDLVTGGDRSCASSTHHQSALLNSIDLGLLSFDDKLSILVANDALAFILDIPVVVLRRSTEVVELLSASGGLPSALIEQMHEACLRAISDTKSTPNLSFASTDKRRAFTLQVSAIDKGQWMACFKEITAQRDAEAVAALHATSDSLTGLCGRPQFLEQLSIALYEHNEPARHAVMIIDLDRFKAVNDTLGHPIGDALLRLVAKRLRAVVRQAEVIARLGGDEFAILVSPMLEQDAMVALAKRIIDVLGRSYLVGGHLVNIGASVGIVLSQDGDDHELLMKNADLALHTAKNAGGGAYSFFEPAMDARAAARRLLEIDLRKAIALREFELHYQPQIDLDSLTVKGFEALIRWRHPERGLVSPDEFIPLAEEIGLIGSIGEWAMRTACIEAMRWPADISVAVNVSSHQFEDSDRLVGMVAEALSRSGLPGRRLEIEITESVLLRNENAVLAALHSLRAMGVRVAIDDFGTGYSSLSQLLSFPFDKIKIDRSFVKDSHDIAGQAAIIRAITALGVSLGMSTIAEGVETAAQLARINDEGCNSVQGYLFSRPVPVEQIDALIAEFSAPPVEAECNSIEQISGEHIP